MPPFCPRQVPYLCWAVLYYFKIFVWSSRKIQQRNYDTLFKARRVVPKGAAAVRLCALAGWRRRHALEACSSSVLWLCCKIQPQGGHALSQTQPCTGFTRSA